MTDGPEDYPIPEGFVMPEEDRELEIRLREIALGYVPWMGYVLPCPEPHAIDPTEYPPTFLTEAGDIPLDVWNGLPAPSRGDAK